MNTVEPPNVDYSKTYDVNSSRAKFGVIIPSTNTTVEHDVHSLAPKGITFPVGRMLIPQPQSANDPEFADIIRQVDEALDDAVDNVMTTKPTYMILAMSAPTFWGGLDSNKRMEDRIRARSGVDGVTTGSGAVVAALRELGAKNISFLSPYQPIGDKEVAAYFAQAGFTVKKALGFRTPSIQKISSTPTSALIEALRLIDDPEADALVQVGTNLSMARLADEAERWLGKPVVTINTAAVWHALRACNMSDQFDGFGELLRNH